jgi:hypothetical protein
VADNARPRDIAVVLSGIAATGLVILAIAITYRLNMWDIRSGWPVTLWRAAMFGTFLTLGLTLITPLLRRRWLGMLVTGIVAALGVLTLVLAIGTASGSVAGLVFTLPAVIACLGLAAVLTTIFIGQSNRYR